ncbi:MAG: gluconate 2-dehydrogenase subunit 3 family protein [Rubricoccaceae bacterium]
MDLNTSMDRRAVLRRLSYALGGIASAPLASGLLGGCQAPAPNELATYEYATLDAPQQDLLSALVDQIIPATDTPGAAEAGVPQFIDKMMTDWYDDEDRDAFLAGLATVDPRAEGGSFVGLAEDARAELVAEMDTEAYEPRPDDAPPGQPFFRQLKDLTLAGYYTSEVGATQELQWLAAPGRYEADIPLSEVGRAWA